MAVRARVNLRSHFLIFEGFRGFGLIFDGGFYRRHRVRTKLEKKATRKKKKKLKKKREKGASMRGKRSPEELLRVVVHQVTVLGRPHEQVAADNLMCASAVRSACSRMTNNGSVAYAKRRRMGPLPAYGDRELLLLDEHIRASGFSTDYTREHMQWLFSTTGLQASPSMLDRMYKDLCITLKLVRERARQSPSYARAPAE